MEQTKGSRTGLVVVSLAILAFVAGVGLGLLLGWIVVPVEFVGTEMGDLAREYKDEFIVLLASAYYADGNLEKAQARLTALDLPNPQQSVSSLIDRFSAEGRSETDIRALVALADALGIARSNTVDYGASSTLAPNDASIPGDGPLPTGAVLFGPTSEPPGPLFTIAESRLLHITENSGCMGKHTVYVEVRDVDGLPLPGEVVCRYRSQQAGEPLACKGSGATEDGPAGSVEFDLDGTSDQVYVASDVNGNDPLSPLSDMFSQADEEIPIPWLIAAGYCEAEDDCQTKIAEHSLCRGHYSYKVVFQRTR
ncbi:MAG: hypothetical protein M8467_15965 [Anaerolineae bacterium]|nr:hypothetical protein [Anaerolineae bacterium]